MDTTVRFVKYANRKDYVDITHFVHKYNDLIYDEEIGFDSTELPYKIAVFTLQHSFGEENHEPRKFRLYSKDVSFPFYVESKWDYKWYMDLEIFREYMYPIILDMVIENEKIYNKYPNYKIKLESEKEFFKRWEDFFSELEDEK